MVCPRFRGWLGRVFNLIHKILIHPTFTLCSSQAMLPYCPMHNTTLSSCGSSTFHPHIG